MTESARQPTAMDLRPCPITLPALALLLGLACTSTWAQRGDAAPRAITPRGALAADELANIEVFKRLSPSVVHITTLATERDFFNRSVQQVPSGTGSGFVWDNAGHIVTNFHVIQEGSGARVTLADQSSWPATLVGAFADRDLAVLKINAPRDKLPAIAIGLSRDLQVFDPNHGHRHRRFLTRCDRDARTCDNHPVGLPFRFCSFRLRYSINLCKSRLSSANGDEQSHRRGTPKFRNFHIFSPHIAHFYFD